MTVLTFEDLEVWKLGRQLRIKFSKLVKTLPESEKFLLTNQLLRASRSVTANIAEGYGRFHFQENIQFCRQSRGSLMELLDHLTVCLDENYINQEHYIQLKNEIFHCIKVLNGYISYLKKAKEGNTMKNPKPKNSKK